MAKIIRKIIRGTLSLLLCGYRYCISPMLGNHCRFYPSCSEYAQQAINKHGARVGIFLTIKRVSRCHPLSTGGYDPIP